VDTLLFDVRWNYTDRGEVYFTTSWVDSRAGFGSLMTGPSYDVPMNLFPDGLPNPGEDQNLADLEFHDYDFSQVHEYSDLRFTEVRATVGLRHQVARHTEVFGSATVYDLTDEAPYLQDVSGRVELYVAGLTWTF
jgi:hypothetical protein